MRSRIAGPAILLCLVAAFVLPAALSAVMAGEEARATPAPSPNPTKGIVVPEAEKGRKNPVPNVPEAVESGRNLFTSQCAMCHGVRPDGSGEVAKSLKLRVPDLTDAARQARRTDGEWFYIISHGHGEMPAEKRLADQQKWEMILYLRTFAKPAASR